MRRRRVFWALTALWLLLIWFQSVLSADLSKEESGRLFLFLQQFLPWLTHNITRKLAHFTEYAVLGSLFLGAVLGGRIRSTAFPPLFGMTAAMVDETVQLFSPGRSGQITDVWLDLAGFLLGYGFFRLIFRKKTRTE